MTFYLAVDVGGTSTRAAVIAPDGTVRGLATAGSGNPTSSGPTIALASMLEAIRTALTDAGAEATEATSGVIGIAGAGAESGAWLLSELSKAGLSGALSLQPDLLTTFTSGSIGGDGYALVAGTGAAAIRVRNDVIDATCDGLGWLLGDSGSGFWIGHRAVRAAADALAHRAPETGLVDTILAALGIARDETAGRYGRPNALNELLDAVYRMRPVELARFAPFVFDAAADGDDTAAGIVDAAGAALASTLTAVVAADVTGPLVLGGSVLSRQSAVADRVAATFHALTGDGQRVIPVADGIAGAAVLALRRAGVDVDADVFDRVHTSLAARR